MLKRAIILAGGKGTRLRPYTVVLPKPLMPIGDFPILEVIVKQLVNHGFTHITMAVNHQAELIQAFFGNGEKWGVSIDYSIETKMLSTMAPLKLIKDLPEHFLVMNGDILTDLNYSQFYFSHTQNNHLFTISAYKKEIKSEFGVLETNSKGNLTGFFEKPTGYQNVSMGIYMISKEILNYIPENVKYGFDNLMKDLINQKILPQVEIFNGIWKDIGNPDDYIEAIDIFEEKQSLFLST